MPDDWFGANDRQARADYERYNAALADEAPACGMTADAGGVRCWRCGAAWPPTNCTITLGQIRQEGSYDARGALVWQPPCSTPRAA